MLFRIVGSRALDERPSRLLSALVSGLVLTALVVVPGLAASPKMERHALVSTGCPRPHSDIVRSAPGAGRTVALTFDDGPSEFTPQILAILRRFGVRATFFQTGAHIAGHRALARQVVAEGHLVANHTYEHRYPQQVPGGWSRAYLTGQFKRTNALALDVTGQRPCFFRPPGGYLTSGLTQTAARLGMSTVMWSVDTEDWKQPGRTTAAATASIVDRASAGGSQTHPVVLFHDGKASKEPEWQVSSNRSNDVAALPAVISFYQARGYRFVDLLGRSGLPPAPTTLHTTSSSLARVPAGTPTVAMTARLGSIGGAAAGERVAWFTRPVGRRGWTLRGEVTTDRRGVATVRDRPRTPTVYTLRYAGTRRLAATRADATSTVDAYLIGTNLTVIGPASVPAGTDVVLEGAVTSAGRARPGVAVTVSRSVDGAVSDLTATTGADGRFRVVDPKPAGTTSYTVRVAKQLPYRSATRTLVVEVVPPPVPAPVSAPVPVAGTEGP